MIISDSKMLENKYLKHGEIEYREYQIHIAKKCVNKNSLVVLPTGLGKTIIAILVAAYTLPLFPKNNKVIILAPTRPLINQHYKIFQKLLTISEDQFVVLTGKVSPGKRKELFTNHQIIFYTPQTLRNDLAHRRYTLSTTCLIVFDEAHHAFGDYPYTLIVDEYLDQNPDGNILALTASPGFSQKKINELCKNLHIHKSNVFSRIRTDTDVKTYIKSMDVYKVGVELTKLMEDVYSIVQKMLEERLQYLKQLGFLDMDKEPLCRNIYRKSLLRLNAELAQLLHRNGDKAGIYTALSVNAQALILYHMLDLVEQQGLDVLLIYLQKLKHDAKKKSSSKAVKILASEYHLYQMFIELTKHHDLSPEILVHPKYKVLRQLIEDQLKIAPDSRILVFVKLRDSVKNVTKKLKVIEKAKVSRFVGQSSKSKDDKGLSQKKQLEILKEFKQGIYNVLVSTNIGEEGLDIAECDLVIFYDVVASEIRFIQRKGRTARHREGKVVILYCKNTHDEIYLNIVMKKLKRMNINLKSQNNNKIGLPKISTLQEYSIREKSTHETSEGISLDPESISKTLKNNSLLKFMKPQALPQKKHSNENLLISRHFPIKFGLRKRLQQEDIHYSISNKQEHITFYNKVLIQIYNPEKFDDSFQHKIITFVSNYHEQYELIVILCDMIDFNEQINGELRVIKQSIKKFSEKHHIQLIPIENVEELYFIFENIYENIQKSE